MTYSIRILTGKPKQKQKTAVTTTTATIGTMSAVNYLCVHVHVWDSNDATSIPAVSKERAQITHSLHRA